jgi:hypothetical protein
MSEAIHPSTTHFVCAQGERVTLLPRFKEIAAAPGAPAIVGCYSEAAGEVRPLTFANQAEK